MLKERDCDKWYMMLPGELFDENIVVKMLEEQKYNFLSEIQQIEKELENI